MAAVPEKPPTFFQRVGRWVMDAVDWVEETLGDPALAAQLREDLGLNTDNPATPAVPADKRAAIEKFAATKEKDLTQDAFIQTVGQIVGLIDTVKTFADAVAADGVDPWDLVTLLFRVWSVQSLKERNPAAYALCQLVGLISAEEETLEVLDPAPALKLLRGNTTASDIDAWIDRLSMLAGGGVVIADAVTRKFAEAGPDAGTGPMEVLFGYDPAPGDDPAAAIAASRTLTVGIPIATGDGGAVTPQLSIVAIAREHGGPGLMLGASGHLKYGATVEGLKVTFEAGLGGAFVLYIPFEKKPVRILTGATPSFGLTVSPEGAGADKPALLIGVPGKTRFEIGRLGLGVQCDSGGAGIRVNAHKGKLAIVLGDGDSFLRQLPGGNIEVPIDLGLLLDTAHGVRIDGGTGLKVNLPVNANLFGVFTVQYLQLEATLDANPVVDIYGGFSLHLGPFQASVDRIGVSLRIGDVIDGRTKLSELVAFSPPKGIGLVLEAGPVKGGGYLYIDAEKGQYAGALELKIMTFSLKAIAIIDTKKPDGSEGWALLVAIYGQFSVHIAFGIFLTGIGGLVGLHHRVDLPALKAGTKTGALDDILFPADPVGQAPRIINQFRTLFPYEEGTLILGPMLQLAFSQPPVVYLNIGLIFEVKNALADTGPVRLSKIVLLGQILAQLPPKATGSPAILKLIVDIDGYYDADEKFLWIHARLRDSFVGIEGVTKLDLAGEFLLAMRFGDQPAFVLSAGGFHPAYKDVPAGVPAQLERLSVAFNINIIRLKVEVYFAVTSNSVQAGTKTTVSASIGIASIEGWLGFDALLYVSPKFHFIVDVHFGVKLKAFGHTLMSVQVDASLEGPGEWHISGSFSFSILFWDKSISFDERWGSAPAVTTESASAKQALQAALADPGSIETSAPLGGNSLVTLYAGKESGALAHPLGRMAVRQKALPLGVRIDRMGTAPLSEGASTYAVESVTIGGLPTDAAEPVQEWFARGHFMELSNQDKLDLHSFERFDCGIAFGSSSYLVPGASTTASADYEVSVLEPEPRLHLYWSVVSLGREAMAHSLAESLVPFGAAARGQRAAMTALRPTDRGRAAVAAPALAVVDAATLTSALEVPVSVASSPALVADLVAAQGRTVMDSCRVIEEYEVSL